jgi:predicted small metal-binding protein
MANVAACVYPCGVLTEELLSTIVLDVVSELQATMAGFSLSKSAQAEVMKSVLKHSEPKHGVKQLLTDSLWEHQLRNIVYSRLQTYVVRAHSFVPADHVKEPVSYIRRAQVCKKFDFQSNSSIVTCLSVVFNVHISITDVVLATRLKLTCLLVFC